MIAHVVAGARRKGVQLWAENGELRYKAPRGALTAEELEALRTSKHQILAYLERSTESEQPSGRHSGPIALTFSQLVHWRTYRLCERPSIRHLASATRLRGWLNVDALRKSLAELFRRHPALHTRIDVVDGHPLQRTDEPNECELVMDDLSSSPETTRESEADRLVEQFVQQPIQVANDPLFGVRLLKLRADEHVLVLACEHLISDALSIGVLLSDLFALYTQAVQGRVLALPAVPMQFADYAVSQKNTHAAWARKHGGYWRERLNGCRRQRFPNGGKVPTATLAGWGMVELHIEADLKARLRDWCRVQRTTLVMSIFTAYIALLMRWCDVSDTVIRYQTDGRSNPKVHGAIGYFASVLYLRLELREGDRFTDLLNRATQEYCKAHEHADLSYVDAQTPRPGYAANAAFNWVPQASRNDFSELKGSKHALASSAMPIARQAFRHYERDNEPVALFYDRDDTIAGGIHFPLNRFTPEIMARFGRNFWVFVTALLEEPQRCLKDIPLCE